jgi:hypothetical protein
VVLEMSKQEEQALTLRLPRDWHEDLRRRAFEERRSIAELIREALMAHFGYQEPQPEEGKKGGVVYAMGGMPAGMLADRKG